MKRSGSMWIVAMALASGACSSAHHPAPAVANAGPQCRSDADCAAGSACVAERCVARTEGNTAEAPPAAAQPSAPPGCVPTSVYFDFDRSALNSQAVQTTDGDAQCLTHAPATGAVVLVGHADPRGTTEYNLALGQARAEATARQLERNGVPRARIQTQSVGSEYARGTDEASWAHDRVVTFGQP